MKKLNESSLLKQRLKMKIKHSLVNSGVVGLSNMARTDANIIRFMWLFLLIASTIGCFYVIGKAISEYTQFNTNISINRVQDLPSSFPAITICNINPFYELNMTKYLTLKLPYFDNFNCLLRLNNQTNPTQFIKIGKECFNSTRVYTILEKLVDKTKRFMLNDNLTNTQRQELGYNLETQMLISCKFNDISCTANNFTKFFSNTYCNCYTFNDGKNQSILQTSQTSSKFGLTLEVLTRKYE